MFNDYMITADSFGAHLPANWEEIADAMNRMIEEYREENGNYPDEDWYDKMWDSYWHDELPNVPKWMEEAD